MKRFLVLSLLTLMASGSAGSPAAAAEITFYVDNLASCAGLTPCFTTIQSGFIVEGGGILGAGGASASPRRDETLDAGTVPGHATGPC